MDEAIGPSTWSSKGPTCAPSSTSWVVSVAATISPVSASRPRCRCYGAGGEEMAPSSLDNPTELPHAKTSRLEPMPCRSGPGPYDHRGHRDEPVQLAGGGGGSGDRASSAQKARS